MCKFNRFAFFILTLCLNILSYAGSYVQKNEETISYEGYIGAGPRLIDDQVMSNTNLDTAMELGLAFSKDCKTKSCYYGLQLFANNAWDARFNSVNNVNNVNTIPALVHNSASMDVLAYFGKDYAKWRGELGVGPQFSWLKWLGSPQQAEDGLRVLPKLRVAISHSISTHSHLYFAFNQAFNVYGSIGCDSGAFNCIDDSGFVSVSDWKLGVSTSF